MGDASARDRLSVLVEQDPASKDQLGTWTLDQLIRAAMYGTVESPSARFLLQQDLVLLGGSPRLGVHNDVQLVYDIGGALRDARPAKGNPLLLRQRVPLTAVAGLATGTVYAVPANRRARIDRVTISVFPPLITDSFFVTNLNVVIAPGPFGFILIEETQRAASITQGENYTVSFTGPLYLDSFDLLTCRSQVVTADAGAFVAEIGLAGVEVDVGFGFSDFPA